MIEQKYDKLKWGRLWVEQVFRGRPRDRVEVEMSTKTSRNDQAVSHKCGIQDGGLLNVSLGAMISHSTVVI